MEPVGSDPTSPNLGDFTVEPMRPRSPKPNRRPRGITVAGVLLLAFGALVAVQLLLPLTPSLGRLPFPLIFASVLPIHHELTLILVAIVTVALGVLVLLGEPRSRFAALAASGAFAITGTVLLVQDVLTLVEDGFDRPVDIIGFSLRPVSAVGLAVAATAFGLLSAASAADWFAARQLTGAGGPSPEPPGPTAAGAVVRSGDAATEPAVSGQSVTAPTSRPKRPIELKLATVAMTVLALYGVGHFLFRLASAKGDEYLTHEQYLVSYAVNDIPPLLVLLAAAIGLLGNRRFARSLAYAAVGWYCYEFTAMAIPYVPGFGYRRQLVGENPVLLLLGLVVAAVAVAAAILLSRRDVTAWFHGRRDGASPRFSPEPSG